MYLNSFYYFEITMNDMTLMAIIDSIDNLPKFATCNRLRHSAVTSNIFCNIKKKKIKENVEQ